LIILDDAGQYKSQEGDRWRLISLKRRFRKLGRKRNAAVALAGDRFDAYAVWDDDDFYLPWALSASVRALEEAPWSRPSVILLEDGHASGRLRQHAAGGAYHAAWAYRREAFEAVKGYPSMNNGEDRGFARRLEKAGIAEADPVSLGFRPFFVARFNSGTPHLSCSGPWGYRRFGRLPVEPVDRLVIEPPSGFELAPAILDGILPRPF
jgi:hypothetical protein